MILDVDYDFLKEAAEFFDARLSVLWVEAKTSIDPDGSGVLDRVEYTTGLGFVACQQYLAARVKAFGLKKPDALSCPPVHRSGVAIAAAINFAANYWKHESEWSNEGLDHRAEATRAELSRLGVDVDRPYVMADTLHVLLSPLPVRFGSLLPFIDQWRLGIGGPTMP